MSFGIFKMDFFSFPSTRFGVGLFHVMKAKFNLWFVLVLVSVTAVLGAIYYDFDPFG